MSAGEIRRASDGGHVLWRVGSIEHRPWLKEPPVAGSPYAAKLPFDNDFEIHAHAARHLWRTLNGRPPVTHFMKYPHSVNSDWPWGCAHFMPDPNGGKQRAGGPRSSPLASYNFGFTGKSTKLASKISDAQLATDMDR